MASRRIDSPAGSPAAAAALRCELHRRLHLHLFDESGATPAGTAIYSLADPREARVIRYIGQTAQPPRRLMQHLRTARLWLPDEIRICLERQLPLLNVVICQMVGHDTATTR